MTNLSNVYNVVFYNSNGKITFSTSGKIVKLVNSCNNVIEPALSNDASSLLKLNVDGKEIINCGESVIISKACLIEDVSFYTSGIKSEALNTRIKISNKKKALVIKSQSGIPMYIFSGNDITCEVLNNMPKVTKFVIDGNAIYAHRITFQIIDTELIFNC